MGERLFQVEKLVLASRIENCFNLIVEEVVEVGGIEGPASAKKFLFESCFKGSRALGQETWVWSITKACFAKHLVEGGLHESSRVGKPQTRSGKQLSATCREESQSNARHSGIAVGAIVNETPARDYREPAECELLLQVSFLIQTLAGGFGRKILIVHEAVFVFKTISEGGVRPGSLRVITLIFQSQAIVMIVVTVREVIVTCRVAVQVRVRVAVERIESNEAMLPAGGSIDAEFEAAEKVVLM